MHSAWTTSKLGSVAQVVASNVDKHVHLDEIPVRLCNYLDVYRNRRLSKPYEFSHGSVKQAEVDRFTIKKGDVLITKDSETPDDIGVPCLIADDFEDTICGYHLALIRPFDGLNSGFLSHVFQSEATRRYFLAKAAGLTRFGLNARTIRALPIPSPQPGEQVAIAGLLDAVELAISNTKAAIVKAERLQTGLMQQLLTGRLKPDGSPRSPREFWMHKKLGKVPVGWSVLRLRDCCDVLDYLRRPVKSQDRAGMRGSFPFYGAAGIIDHVNSFLFDGEFILFGEDGENLISRKLPQAWIVRGKFWVNNHAHVLKPQSPHDIRFICWQLENRDYRPLVIGSAQPKINQAELNNLWLALPQEGEQRVISDRIEAVANLILARQKKIAALQRLKKSLMQNLLTGRIRLPVNGAAKGTKP